MGNVPFIAAWVEGGWGGRDGSAFAASARPRPVSSARTRGCKRRSERLLQRPRVEATRAWHFPLAAGAGVVDGALEPRRATRHDGEGQRTLSTRLRAHAGNARHWPPRHAFGSGSLDSRAACSRTSSSRGRLQNPTGAAPMRADAGGQRRWDTTVHRSRRDGSRWQMNTRLPLWHGVVMGGRLIGGNLAGLAMWA
jgi:hypothetical protein